jgi:hypothetical protein
VKHDRVYAADSNSYFSRPGPRLSEGVSILATLLHPTRVRIDLTRQPAPVRRVSAETTPLQGELVS